MSDTDRYFVDLRSGCVAVRDRKDPNYDPDYRGLHADTPDVVQYWGGKPETHKCSLCGHERRDGWSLPVEASDAARLLCHSLNAAARAQGDRPSTKETT